MSDSLPQLTIRDRYAHKILTEHHKTFKTLPPPRPTLPTTELRRSGSWDHRPVGIIGAGAAGLYAGMILDTLGIPYEILEASGRVGGRLHTHKFSNEKNDYYVSSNVLHITDVDSRVRLSGRRGDAISRYTDHVAHI